MSLLLAATKRASVAPSAIATGSGSYTTTVVDSLASLTTLFQLSVTGLGQADGAWAIISTSGPIAGKIGLSATTGASVNLITTGSIVGLTGASGCSVTWTGQGGSPVLTQGFVITVSTTQLLAFNPSKLGWHSLLMTGSTRLAPLRVNAAGQQRPWDGASHFYVNGPWSQNMIADNMWNSPRNWISSINTVLASNNNSGLVFNIGFYMFNPLPGSTSGLHTHPGSPSKAAFKASNPTSYLINSIWPIGTASGDTMEQTRVKTATTWQNYADGWFDDVILGPWIGANGLFAKFQALSLPYLKIILRPCWEGDDDWWWRNPSKTWIEAQCYTWVNSYAYAKIVKAAFRNLMTVLNNAKPAGFPTLELALGPLIDDHGPTNELAYRRAIHTPDATDVSDTEIFQYVGADVYDSFVSDGVGYPGGHDNVHRFATQSSAEMGLNYWRTFMTGSSGLGYKLCIPEWGTNCGVAGVDPVVTNVENFPPTSNNAGCDNPDFIDGMWNWFVAEQAAGRMGFEQYYYANHPWHELGVTNPSAASPTYVGASNKPDASKRFHTYFGLHYNPLLDISH